MESIKIIKNIIAQHWLQNDNFTGMSSYSILKKIIELEIDLSEDQIKEILLELEKENLITTREIESGDRVSYVWIDGRFEDKIDPGPHTDLWAYPERKLLEQYDDTRVEDVGIYIKQLKLGGSQIEHRFFNIQVLERYREDPRYMFMEHGSSGFICIKDEFFIDDSVPEEDKILIQSYGYAYDYHGNEVVAVILSDLGSLSVKHQAHWNSFEIRDQCKLDPDYIETNFEARFTNRVSIYRAFRQELEEINTLCTLMGEPPLFLNNYLEDPPSKFGILTKPTEGEYYDFIQILDKMLSDNINKKFFKNKIPLTYEEKTKDDKVRIIDKATITLLDEYLYANWKFPDPEPREEMIKVFRDIRRQRRIPAHYIKNDHYDDSLIQKQKDFMIECYKSIRTLRLIFQNHPKAIAYEPPKWLNEGRII